MLDGMKIQKRIKWLKPYILSAKNLVDLTKLKSVTGYTVPIYKETNQQASIIYNIYGKRRYDIKLNLKINYCLSKKQTNVGIASFLDSLAHELSHIEHIEHTPEHFALQAKILLRFARVLKKTGVNFTDKRIKL